MYARAFGSELVLLDFGCGEYYGLDEVGTEIWRALEAGQALGEVADVIVGRYEVPREEALSDILALVSQLHEQGLLVVAQPDV